VSEQATTLDGPETSEQEAPELADEYNVILQLSDGERIEAGSYSTEREAHGYAEQLMASAATATSSARWPRIGDRYFRPETIVSIGVERSTQPRWTGSTGRANTWTGRPPGA
jgi:hypothetical protein